MGVDTGLGGSIDAREAAAEAERDGYAGAWTSEITHDPFVALGLAAVATDTIELGTAIVVAFARNPMSLAMQANDVQLLSRGRLLLGLGSHPAQFGKQCEHRQRHQQPVRRVPLG